MIHAIIFDIGNVLLRFDYQRALHAMLLRSGTPVEKAARAAEPLVPAYERGEMVREEFLVRLAQAFNYSGPVDTLADIWSAIFTPNTPMVALVESLEGRCPMFVISNTSDLHMDYIRRTYPFYSRFRDAVYSYEVGRLKPEPEIFAHAIGRFGVEPSRTLYIDDLKPNIDAAAGAGLVTHHYDPERHDRFAEWFAGFEIGVEPR